MQFGDYRIEIIPDTEFRLDGGAMFGVVPRVLWEKTSPPDEFNRIQMNMNCLFVETPTEKILVETGIGEKWTEKQTKIYGIFRTKPFAQSLFEKTGCRPEDITIVVNTHLHFDHAGGNTILEEDKRRRGEEEWEEEGEKGRKGERETLGSENQRSKTKDQSSKIEDQKPKTENQRTTDNGRRTVPQFPNARYFVSESEFYAAENPLERDRASYLPENWRPLQESGQLELKVDEYEVVEGLTLQKIRGHSETMQTVCLKRGGETLYGFADLIPTTAHLPYAWIMGYDLFPVETLAAKKILLPKALRENWICLFYHNFTDPLCRLTEKESKMQAIAL